MKGKNNRSHPPLVADYIAAHESLRFVTRLALMPVGIWGEISLCIRSHPDDRRGRLDRDNKEKTEEAGETSPGPSEAVS